MTPANFTYDPPPECESSIVREGNIESAFIETLRGLKYTERPDIRDRASLEANFREKLEALNRVKLTESEFQRLLEEIVTSSGRMRTTPTRRKSTSPSWWTCCSPASIPNTSTRSTWIRTSSTTA